MEDFINTLESAFKEKADPHIAFHQKAYMKNHFEFFGMKAPVRRKIQQPFLVKQFLPPKGEMKEIVKELWNKDEREFHHFAQELASKYSKDFTKDDIKLFEYMVLNKSWWDTVDFIAPTLIGNYFKKFPEERDKTIKKWLASNNIWLQRSCVIFQLKYKKDLDENFMAYVINNLLGSKEFFINKAIGWILREYGKLNPEWVIDFADKTDLSNLSRREALRIIKLNY